MGKKNYKSKRLKKGEKEKEKTRDKVFLNMSKNAEESAIYGNTKKGGARGKRRKREGQGLRN